MYEVYMITNRVNDMKYVGVTRQGIADRWAKHKSRHNKSRLKEAIEHFGSLNFTIEVIESHTDLLDAMIAELQNIKRLNTNYPNGYNNLYTEDCARKISDRQKGISKSQEHRDKVSSGLIGLKQSAETVEKRVGKVRKQIIDQHGTIYHSVNAAAQAAGVKPCVVTHICRNTIKNPRCGFKFSYYTEVK